MEYILKVPKPCNESWDEMTPVAGGRNCALCSKTVIDFTGWRQEDIVDYIHDAGRKVCGRFREEQLNAHIDTDHFILAVAASVMPLARKVAAIFLLAFGLLSLSDPTAIAQVPQHKVVDTGKHSPAEDPGVMGKIKMPSKHIKKKRNDQKAEAQPAQQAVLTGFVSMETIKAKRDTGKRKRDLPDRK